MHTIYNPGIMLSYTHAVNQLTNVLTSIGTSIGSVIMVAGGIRLAIAIKNFDQNGEHTAIYSIVAGSLLLGLSALIAALS